MLLEVKREILKRFYAESIKEMPDYDKNINAGNLKVNADDFINALDELQNEKYISGVKFQAYTGKRKPLLVSLKLARIEQKGIDEVERDMI